MSTDLIALIVAVGLGIVIVVVGLRRDLSETTRSNLPRFGGDSEPAAATVGEWEGERRGKPLSSRQERWLALLNLPIALGYVAYAFLSSDKGLLHVVAAGFALAAVVMTLRALRRHSGAS